MSKFLFMTEHYDKHIGVLGGMAPESTVDLYGRLVDRHKERFGDDDYPEISIRSVSPKRVFEILDTKPLDKEALVGQLTPRLGSLAVAGVDFIVIAANTPHVVLDELQANVDKPIRSIVEATRDEAMRKEVEHPLLIGTGITMTDGFFQRPFTDSGIEIATPNATDQEMIDTIITEGIFDEESRLAILRMLQRYSPDGIIVGCTELSPLVKPEDVDVALLDTADIQAKDTLEQALR
jgi:aspartate racemase